MDLLDAWWQNEVVKGHKRQLLLSFVMFVAAFVTTRAITRLIGAGRSPFHSISSGGVHMHHSTNVVTLAAVLDDRWGPVRRRWDDIIGGAPTADSPAKPMTATLVAESGLRRTISGH